MTGCFPTPACELPGGPYTLLVGWAGWLLAALAVLGAGFALQLILDGVFRLLVLIPAVRRRLLAPTGPTPPTPELAAGPVSFDATPPTMSLISFSGAFVISVAY